MIGLLLALALAASASLPDADPAIWVVKDQDTTIYLFGTFHLLDGKSEWFNDEVKTAFDASEEVVLEAVPPENPLDLQSLVLKYAVDPNGRTLSSKLPSDLMAKVDKELSAIGIPLASLEPMEPWFILNLLAVRELQKQGLSGDLGAEAVITQAAKGAGKPLSALEGIEFQLKLFDEIPEDLQIQMLKSSLDQTEDLEGFLKPLLAAWSRGDEETFARIFNQDLDEFPMLYDILLTRRNTAWAEWIAQRLDKPGTVFLAVGAGHLAGKDSVQEELKARGIKSARIAR